MSVRSTWRGPKITRDMEEAAARGLYKWAEHVLEEANRIVPLREGILQDTGVAFAPGEKGLDDLEAAVAFDTPYAVKQHEDMSLSHPGGRQAKYLEMPLNASKDKGLKTVADEIKHQLGG